MNQLYKLTPQELATRKDIVVLSDKGLRFREDIKSQSQFDLDDFHLPQVNQQKDKPQTRKQVLQGEKPIELLVADLKKELNINRPYMEKALEKMTMKITSAKPSAVINNKLQKLYQELEQNIHLLERKKVKFQKKPIQQLDQSSILEESEFQDKMASLNALEAKLWRMQQNYQNEIKIRDDTLKKVKQNLIVMKIQKEAEIEQVPIRVQMDKLQQSQYLDRKQIRLKDYQKYKFEKVWSKQPPPSYTSKQMLIEEERRKQLILMKEQQEQEYEQELLKRNGSTNINNITDHEQ